MTQFKVSVLPRVRSAEHHCEDCHALRMFVLAVQPIGIAVGLPFMQPLWSSGKAYYAMCSTCTWGFRLTNEQAFRWIDASETEDNRIERPDSHVQSGEKHADKQPIASSSVDEEEPVDVEFSVSRNAGSESPNRALQQLDPVRDNSVADDVRQSSERLHNATPRRMARQSRSLLYSGLILAFLLTAVVAFYAGQFSAQPSHSTLSPGISTSDPLSSNVAPSFVSQTDALTEIRGLCVLVDKLSPDSIKVGLNETELQSFVESTLQRDGVPIASLEQYRNNRRYACVNVLISTKPVLMLDGKPSAYSDYVIQLNVEQIVTLTRDEIRNGPDRVVRAVTWELPGAYDAIKRNELAARVRLEIEQLAKMLATDFRTANRHR